MVIVRNGNSFCGYVPYGSRSYVFEIIPDNAIKNEALFKLDERLKKLLGDSLDTFLKVNDFQDPIKFHEDFINFVKEKLGKPNEPETWLKNPLPTCDLIESLEEEMETIEEYIKSFDIENRIIEIEVTDPQLRTHKAILQLEKNYKVDPIVVVSHDLPLQKSGIFQTGSDLSYTYSVSEFCDKFLHLITQFQNFWNTVAILDSECWVLDPANPTFKDIYRRIKLKDTLSVVLTFNPVLAEQRPSIKLLGSQSDVNYYRDILQESLANEVWDDSQDLLYNISNILQVTIPCKMIEEEQDLFESAETGECAICFTWRLEDEIPNEVCERSTCKSMYHSKCLFTYLSSLTRNRSYFGKIQGECPNCDEIISCTIPKFM